MTIKLFLFDWGETDGLRTYFQQTFCANSCYTFLTWTCLISFNLLLFLISQLCNLTESIFDKKSISMNVNSASKGVCSLSLLNEVNIMRNVIYIYIRMEHLHSMLEKAN